jgi:eukaryotic-like serine/threonine-protein kinase
MVSTLRVALLAFALAFAAGCGGDDDEGSTKQATTGPGASATVPDVQGLQLLSASDQFADEGLRVAVKYVPSQQRKGNVVGQQRPAGTELQRGDTVGLTVSNGPSAEGVVPVPDAVDKTAAEGQSILEQAGFSVHAIPIPALTEDRVIYHSPAAGTRIPRGSVVVLYHGG